MATISRTSDLKANHDTHADAAPHAGPAPAPGTPTARAGGPLADLPATGPDRNGATRRITARPVLSTSVNETGEPASASRAASAPPSPHLRTMMLVRSHGLATAPARRPPFDEMKYDGSRAAARWPMVAQCLQWARQAGFSLHPTRETSCTIRNAAPYYDARSGTVKYEREPQRGVGTILLNTQMMENATLAALTIIHEVTHARRGPREHAADPASYRHERLTDEGESVYQTLRFTAQAMASDIDRAAFVRDAAVAMPLACIQEWHAAYQQHGGMPSEALFRKLGEIYDRHVPQSAGWDRAFERMAARLKLPLDSARFTEIG
ncbi:hypothetical protein [Burkholderia sp. 22PA0106]|uniref:hypothetical protein n=1 Tax=Burkholderia sp. 22PA0106 TaxID=3237371 RepID=UPI0039C085B2